MFPEVWRGLDGIYGGYVLARVIEAVQIVDGFMPLNVNIQFMGTVRDVESDWQIALLHQGHSTAAVSVEVRQGAPKLTAVAKLGTGFTTRILGTPTDLTHLGDPESLPQFSFDGGGLRYEAFFDQRLITSGSHSREEQNHAWIRLDESVHEAPELGPHALCGIFLDALIPGLFFTPQPPKFVPTIEFSVHFAPDVTFERHGWHYVQQRTVWATAEFCVEESSLYARSGGLLAQARQTRRVLWDP